MYFMLMTLGYYYYLLKRSGISYVRVNVLGCNISKWRRVTVNGKLQCQCCGATDQ